MATQRLKNNREWAIKLVLVKLADKRMTRTEAVNAIQKIYGEWIEWLKRLETDNTNVVER